MVDFKKILKKGAVIVGVAGLIASSAMLGGCSSEKTYTAAEYDAKVTDVTVNDVAVSEAAVAKYIASLNQTTAVKEVGEPVVYVKTGASPKNCDPYVIDNLYLGSNVVSELDNGDFCALNDGELTFDEETYDYKDYLMFGPGMEVAYSGGDYSYKFEGEPALVIDRKSLRYEYELEDFDYSEISKENPLKIDFLGSKLTITKFEDNEVTISKGTKVKFKVGQTYEGITVDGINDDEISLVVNGEPDTIDEKDSARINGVEIYVDNLFNSDDDEKDFATLLIQDVSGDAVKTLKDGESYDENWDMIIDQDAGILGVKLAESYNDYETALKLGDSIELPDKFARIAFEASAPKTEDYKFEIDSIDLGDASVKAVMLNGDLECDNGDANEVAIVGDKFYVKDDGEYVETSDVRFAINQMPVEVNAGIISIGDLNFGMDLDKEIVSSIDYNGKDIIDRDTDVLAKEGFVIVDPENNSEDGVVEILKVPKKEVEYSIKVTSIEA